MVIASTLSICNFCFCLYPTVIGFGYVRNACLEIGHVGSSLFQERLFFLFRYVNKTSLLLFRHPLSEGSGQKALVRRPCSQDTLQLEGPVVRTPYSQNFLKKTQFLFKITANYNNFTNFILHRPHDPKLPVSPVVMIVPCSQQIAAGAKDVCEVPMKVTFIISSIHRSMSIKGLAHWI